MAKFLLQIFYGAKFLADLGKAILLLCQGLKEHEALVCELGTALVLHSFCTPLKSTSLWYPSSQAFFKSLATSFSCATCATSKFWNHILKSGLSHPFLNTIFFFFQATEAAFPAISAAKQVFASTKSKLSYHANKTHLVRVPANASDDVVAICCYNFRSLYPPQPVCLVCFSSQLAACWQRDNETFSTARRPKKQTQNSKNHFPNQQRQSVLETATCKRKMSELCTSLFQGFKFLLPTCTSNKRAHLSNQKKACSNRAAQRSPFKSSKVFKHLSYLAWQHETT